MKYFLIMLFIIGLAQSSDNFPLESQVPSKSINHGTFAKITRVIDADTMDVLFKDGATERVRLSGGGYS